ncbi:MAG: DnaJ domain-containing protein [Benniella sp.]|nr:MAG: DnaJ domain-containing protein [Benniella sp.]
MTSFPDYYELLHIHETATADEIREAYKREALRTHPDRTTNIGGPNGDPLSHEEATALFQQVADAYYVLSDPSRREQYDKARKTRSRTSRATWGHAEPDRVFGNVFEELLRPEIDNPSTFYSPIGMASGAALGFICGGLPGALVGAYGGKTLGRIRDQKGVSVMEAFGRLEHAKKAAIIAALAAQVFHTLK